MLGRKLIETYKNGNRPVVLMMCRTLRLYYRENPYDQNMLKDFYNMGCIYRSYGDLKNAVDVLLEASRSSLLQSSGNYPLGYKIFTNLAVCYYEKYGTEKSTLQDIFEYFNTAIRYAIMGFSADSPQYANALHNIAVMYYETEDYDMALQYLYKIEELEKTEYHCDNLNYIGYCLEKKGEKERALMFFKMAISEIKENSQMGEYVANLCYLSKFYIRNGNFSEALSTISEVIDILDSNGYSKNEMYVNMLVILARAYFAAQDYKKAINTINRALMLGEEIIIPDKSSALVMKAAANIYMAYGDYEAAVEVLKKACDIDALADSEDVFEDCMKIVKCSVALDRLDICEEYAEKLYDCPLDPKDRYMKCMYCLVNFYILQSKNDRITEVYEDYVLPLYPDMTYEKFIEECISNKINNDCGDSDNIE